MRLIQTRRRQSAWCLKVGGWIPAEISKAHRCQRLEVRSVVRRPGEGDQGGGREDRGDGGQPCTGGRQEDQVSLPRADGGV